MLPAASPQIFLLGGHLCHCPGVPVVHQTVQEAPHGGKGRQGSKGRRTQGLHIYLSGPNDAGCAETVCKEIIDINIKGEVNQIQMIINSSAGSCPACFSIIDIMEWELIPIYTTAIGMIASMGLLVFMTGEKGRRVMPLQIWQLLRTTFCGARFWKVFDRENSWER